MDWWPSVSSCGASQSSPAASSAEQLEAAAASVALDPWLNCDDLDLGAIIQQQTTAAAHLHSNPTDKNPAQKVCAVSILAEHQQISSSSPSASKAAAAANKQSIFNIINKATKTYCPASTTAVAAPNSSAPTQCSSTGSNASPLSSCAELSPQSNGNVKCQTTNSSSFLSSPNWSLSSPPAHLTASSASSSSSSSNNFQQQRHKQTGESADGKTIIQRDDVQQLQQQQQNFNLYQIDGHQHHQNNVANYVTFCEIQPHQQQQQLFVSAAGAQQSIIQVDSKEQLRSLFQQSNGTAAASQNSCTQSPGATVSQSSGAACGLQTICNDGSGCYCESGARCGAQQHGHISTSSHAGTVNGGVSAKATKSNKQISQQNSTPGSKNTCRPNNCEKQRRCRSIENYVLADEEKRLLIKEGYSDFPMICQSTRPLSKSDEKILRRIRRKIRNKKSAQCSRQRKKEYVEDLERNYAATKRENEELKQILLRIQRQQAQQDCEMFENQNNAMQQEQQQRLPIQQTISYNQNTSRPLVDSSVSPSNETTMTTTSTRTPVPNNSIQIEWKDLFETKTISQLGNFYN